MGDVDPQRPVAPAAVAAGDEAPQLALVGIGVQVAPAEAVELGVADDVATDDRAAPR